jgi:hypothetical protein
MDTENSEGIVIGIVVKSDGKTKERGDTMRRWTKRVSEPVPFSLTELKSASVRLSA